MDIYNNKECFIFLSLLAQLLFLCWCLTLRGLTWRRLALRRLFCCRRASAAFVTPLDAPVAPLLTPRCARRGGFASRRLGLAAGSLRLGGGGSKGEARRGRQSEKGQYPSTRDHFRFNFCGHVQPPRFSAHGNLGLAPAYDADPNQTNATAGHGVLSLRGIPDDHSPLDPGHHARALS